jgi:hypothetical protein
MQFNMFGEHCLIALEDGIAWEAAMSGTRRQNHKDLNYNASDCQLSL